MQDIYSTAKDKPLLSSYHCNLSLIFKIPRAEIDVYSFLASFSKILPRLILRSLGKPCRLRELLGVRFD